MLNIESIQEIKETIPDYNYTITFLESEVYPWLLRIHIGNDLSNCVFVNTYRGLDEIKDVIQNEQAHILLRRGIGE